MAGFATSATHHHIVMAMFVVVVCYASGIMAQSIAPSPAMDAGAGLTLPISDCGVPSPCTNLSTHGY
ncbi:hypothetical protein V6N11_028921 [Hibiscus sabdariffa]|uniref:Uncharacterized protein n=1 Tax=Hibiscus sabdariffa TaxID=183260 RepID=A0ABR2AC12_9ROSI